MKINKISHNSIYSQRNEISKFIIGINTEGEGEGMTAKGAAWVKFAGDGTAL